MLQAAKSDGIELVIIDTAPHAAPEAAAIARAADLVLVPVRPTAFDLAALPAPEIAETRAFARASATRWAVTEFEADGRAADDGSNLSGKTEPSRVTSQRASTKGSRPPI